MSIKPILFNTEMVRAILDGRKTQTRRVVKEFIGEEILSISAPDGIFIGRYCRDGWLGELPDRHDGNTYCIEAKPPCKVGDILWVREAYCEPYAPGKYSYRADYDEHDVIPNRFGHVSLSANMFRWKPSIHMPREAARIFLRVTDVRVERLQDITEDDVCDEGAEPIISCHRKYCVYNQYGVQGDMCWNTDFACKDCPELSSYAELFGEEVWNETIKKSDMDKCGWSANPWVFVIEFERCENPEGWY